MVVTDPRGSLADVHAARRALCAKLEPSAQFYLAWAVGFALFCGSSSGALELAGAVALPAATMAAAWWQSRRARFICPSRIRLFSRRAFVLGSLLSVVGMVVVLAMATTLAAALLHRGMWTAVLAHRGTPLAYLVPFVVFTVPVMAAVMLPWRLDPYGIDARPMRKVPDRPAVVDPVIEPRQRITVCATLASLDWIEARFLANMLGVPDEALHQRTAELLAAQYVDVHPHNGRWWFGLTAVGRAAYRRHLRALQAMPEGRPIVAADEFAKR
jgi:hypothetical protein